MGQRYIGPDTFNLLH